MPRAGVRIGTMIRHGVLLDLTGIVVITAWVRWMA